MKILPNIKALIFDCDGTLADSEPLHSQAWRENFAEYGLECIDQFFEDHAGIPSETIVHKYNKLYGQNLDPQKFAQEVDSRAFEKLLHVQPVEPVVRIVQDYYRRLPMGVASSGNPQNVLRTLKVLGLDEMLPVVVTIQDVERPKPWPDIFLRAAELLEVDPGECQVFEDADAGIEAAKAAGMNVVDIRPFKV
ncbi:HAD-IA family hydrolase [candidate division KSB1 bacterium]|nr:HAD-IA family hydrolase [candidate division KSB1 bacterium]